MVLEDEYAVFNRRIMDRIGGVEFSLVLVVCSVVLLGCYCIVGLGKVAKHW